MRRDRLVSGETTLTRMWVLSAVAVVLGLIGGIAAVVLFKLISLMTHLTLLGDVGFDLPTLRGFHPGPMLIVYAVGGGLLVSVIALWAPVIRGHGIPESLEAILDRDSRIRPRAAIAKPLSAAITIGTGGPFGAEGPIIVTGGSMGSLIGQLLSVSAAERKIMLATGACAGMSATFNTPIAAVILAIELVLFERSLRVIVPLAIASGVAAAIHVYAFGGEPLFMVATELHVSLARLPWYALVGVASGLTAIVLNKGLFAMEAAFRKLPVNIFFWPAIGALGFALIGLLVPRTLSMGYSAIIDTLNGKFTIGMLALLLIAKLASWLIALGSQTSGGTLAPMFLVGATMGALLGEAVNAIFPGAHVSPAAFALVAMGATFGAATKAVFAAVVFAAEVTGEYTMLVPLLIATGIAELVVEGVLTDRLMTEKLSHRGFKVEFRTAVDALRTRVARQVMRDARWVPADASMIAARDVLTHHGVDRMAVAGPAGDYRGTLSLVAVERALAASDESAQPHPCTVADIVDSTIAPIRADEYLSESLERFLRHAVESLPVVSDGMVVGALTRADLLAERYRRSRGQELRQAGWLASLRLPGRGRSQLSSSATQLPTEALLPAHPGSGQPSPHRQHARETSYPGSHGTVHRLLPLPASVTPGLGQFVLTERSRVVVSWGSDAARPVAEQLATDLRPATGFRISVSDGRAYGDDISLTLAEARELTPEQSREGYVLRTGVSGVQLTAPTLRGLHHGVQTIRQLLPVWITSGERIPGDWTVPAMTVVDYPRVAQRRAAIDLTGSAAPRLIMHMINRLADYKINIVRLSAPAVDGPQDVPGYDDIAAVASSRHVTLEVARADGDAEPVSTDAGRLDARLLAIAEAGWSRPPQSEPTTQARWASRAAAQGPRLALSGTAFDADDTVPWRLHLVALPGHIHGRRVAGAVGKLVAPGFLPGDLTVTVDWGDGAVDAVALVAGTTSTGAEAGYYTIVGDHQYSRGGNYRVVVLAAADGAVPARASVPVRVGSTGKLRLRRGGSAPALVTRGRDDSAVTTAP